MTVTILVSIACFIIGGFLSYMFFKHGLKSKYDNILKEAEAEAEVIKKNKLLEVKEKFLNKKADLEKEVAIRNFPVASNGWLCWHVLSSKIRNC